MEIESQPSGPIERMVGVGITWKLAGQLAVQGMRLATVAVLARFLTPADYGTAAIAVACATFAPTVADMGIGSALVQIEWASHLVRSTAFWTSIAFGACLLALSVLASGPVAGFLGEPEVGLMVVAGGLIFAIYSIGSASQAVFMREMRFRSIELRNWTALAIGSVVGITVAAAGGGAWALVIQQLALMTALATALWWRAGWRPGFEFSPIGFRRLVSFALRIAGGRWARLAELLVLTLMIGHFASIPELGAWTFAMSMVVLPLTMIAIPIAEVLFSAFSRLRDQPERMAALWLDSIAYLAAVMLPLLLGLMIVSPDLIPVAFGSRWEVSVVLVQILSVSVIIRGLQSWGSVYMDAVGRPEVTLWTQLASLALTPFAVLIGIHWGIEGVAVCWVITQLIAVEIPMFVIVLAQMRVSASTVATRLVGVTAAALMMAAVCLFARQALIALGVGPAPRAALTIAVAVAAYVPAMWWLAPQLTRRAVGTARRRLGAVISSRRREPALQA